MIVKELMASSVKARPAGNAREPTMRSILAMAESIAQLGLIEPIVVDRVEHLIAGGTRLAAVQLLLIGDGDAREEAWCSRAAEVGEEIDKKDLKRVRALQAHSSLSEGRVPVRVLDLDARYDRDGALAAEVAENERRSDMSKKEIVALVGRLRKAGFTDRAGRPRKGEKALKPQLAAILGKSLRTVERILAGVDDARGRPRLSDRGGRQTLVLSVEPELDLEVRTLAKEAGQSVSAFARELLGIGLAARRDPGQ